MELLMPGLHRPRVSLSKQGLALLEWLLLLVSAVSHVTCTGCRFPDFLQSSDQGMGHWTCQYGEKTTLRIEVMGGEYLIFMNSNTTFRGRHRHTSWTETVLIQRRRCVQRIGHDKFIVEHVEQKPAYQCIQFIQRSPYVVQLNLSPAEKNWTNICQLNLTLDEFPWISLKGYLSAVTKCPFSGGLNFHNVAYHKKSHVRTYTCPDTKVPVRVESDCQTGDGIEIKFGDDHCVRPKLKSTRFLCMASWYDEDFGDGFALIRNAIGDRQFYCLRIRFHNNEVVYMYLYLDWVCYRAHDLGSTEIKFHIATPYITFHRAKKEIISYTCSETCSDNENGCEGVLCVNSTSIPCEFSDDVIGKWQIRQTNKDATFEIQKSGIQHPSLGLLKCVSFNDQPEARLRVVLSESFMNGCFPRFLCLHFDMPGQSVMRYRMGDVLQWPLTLSEENICHVDKFQVPPDMRDPRDTYHSKPWSVALRSSDVIPTNSCVLPSYIPRHTSFVSHDNRYGCITLRPNFAPSTVSLAFFEEGFGSKHPSKSKILIVEKFHCVAVLTYTSIVTMSPGNPQDFLCWVVVHDKNIVQIVVIKTSSCNEWTARRIINETERYAPDMAFKLTLGAGGKELVNACGKHYKEEKSAWLAGYEDNMAGSHQVGGDSDGMTSSSHYYYYQNSSYLLLLCTALSLAVNFVCSNGCAFPFNDLLR